MKIDWQALSAIATFLAVIVALLPIFIAHTARRAKARNLRMRVAVKLTKIKPTFASIVSPSTINTISNVALLSSDDLTKVVASLEALLKESEVLNSKEQDRLSQVVANLELVLPLMSSERLTSGGATSILKIIDESISVIEKNGIMFGKPYQPWKQ